MDINFIIFLSIKLGIAIFLTFLTLVMAKKHNKTANKWLTAFVSGILLLSLSDLIRQSETSLPGIKKMISVDLIIFMLPPALVYGHH
ncbi:hypothetical protein ED312_08350 [Sinomicrobium pectinilyticum]|uniref:Uncharacterized protein n=1 Tax=Sinomicrobium pectinilyticum TaxID=1084421 RepID=A0A3N0EKP2_SINP1|nr:hypothetical protein ED312_08350 [Sinomicrobium pectinilyticum]